MIKTKTLFLALFLIVVSLGNTNTASAGLIDPAAENSGCCNGLIRGYWFEAPTAFTMDSVWLNTLAGLSTSYRLEILLLNATPPEWSGSTTDFITLASFSNLSGVFNVNFNFAANNLIGILAWDNNLSSTPYSTAFSQNIEGSPVTLTRFLRQSLTTGGPVSSEAGGPIGAIGFSYNSAVTPPVAVPAPATILILGIGLLGLSLRRKA
ncbi:PEP-CTERM sorting domain-containing protein [Arsukibacterium perlucidum]|uniref:PEP-CTERM sorting domain-containing protein n=1 Tax=Arsukibacterium perlucidum TaxID=368811 RepID=UPI00036BDE57|nr:PEP-CTERM sorting domain-containing protein [Arsukibacterium perlucidum]